MNQKVHITIPFYEASRERQMSDKQCPSIFSGRSIVFCVRPDGHTGDHRGLGRQWKTVTEKEEE